MTQLKNYINTKLCRPQHLQNLSILGYNFKAKKVKNIFYSSYLSQKISSNVIDNKIIFIKNNNRYLLVKSSMRQSDSTDF